MDNKTVVDRIKEAKMNEIMSTLDNVYSGLVDSKEAVYGTIPESVFVNYFLPYFTKAKTDNSNWVMEWISIAGSPTSPVKVFNETSREVMYEVPGLLDSSVLDISKGANIKQVIDAADLYGSNLPELGSKFLTEALYDKANKITESVNENTESVWKGILERYNLTEKEEVVSKEEDDLTSMLELE